MFLDMPFLVLARYVAMRPSQPPHHGTMASWHHGRGRCCAFLLGAGGFGLRSALPAVAASAVFGGSVFRGCMQHGMAYRHTYLASPWRTVTYHTYRYTYIYIIYTVYITHILNINIHIHLYTHIYMYIYTYTYMICIYIHAHTHTHIYKYLYIYICMYVCICIYIYMYMHMS